MFCTKCGQTIQDDAGFCSNCGISLKKASIEETVIYESQVNNEASIVSYDKNKMPRKNLMLIGGVLCCAIMFLIIGVMSISKANLKNDIVKKWRIVDSSVIKVLDIYDDTMEYSVDTIYDSLDTTLGIFDWKVISGNKIKIDRFGDGFTTFTVELNDDKNILTVTPSITNTDSSETWYYLD